MNTLPAEKYSAKLEPDSGPIKLKRSGPERQRYSNILASEAAQIFDNKISIQNPNSCQQFPGTEPNSSKSHKPDGEESLKTQKLVPLADSLQ